MARANLHISKELQDTFKKAVGGGIRYISAAIEGEDIKLTGSQKIEGDAATDFAAMAAGIAKNSPQYVIFLDNPNVGKWTLISYVPEFANVRLKMLFSSSRDDVRNKLGPGNFDADYQATEPEDVSYTLYKESRSSKREDGPLTMREEYMREEKMTSHAAAPSSAMGNVAFAMSADLKATVTEFKAGHVKWVEMSVDLLKETTELSNSVAAFSSSDMASLVVAAEPRFYLCNVDGQGLFFVYCCPDASAVRTRMMYSSSKNNIMDELEAVGIVFNKKIEIRDASDLIDEASGVVIDATMASADPVFSRPKGPAGARRGRKRGPRK